MWEETHHPQWTQRDSEMMEKCREVLRKNVGAKLSPEKSHRGLERLNLVSVQPQAGAC